MAKEYTHYEVGASDTEQAGLDAALDAAVAAFDADAEVKTTYVRKDGTIVYVIEKTV